MDYEKRLLHAIAYNETVDFGPALFTQLYECLKGNGYIRDGKVTTKGWKYLDNNGQA